MNKRINIAKNGDVQVMVYPEFSPMVVGLSPQDWEDAQMLMDAILQRCVDEPLLETLNIKDDWNNAAVIKTVFVILKDDGHTLLCPICEGLSTLKQLQCKHTLTKEQESLLLDFTASEVSVCCASDSYTKAIAASELVELGLLHTVRRTLYGSELITTTYKMTKHGLKFRENLLASKEKSDV